MEKKEFLTDQNGTIVYPKTVVEAIIDAAQKLVLNGGDQSGIKGVKDFVDGLQINGQKVLAEGDVKPFELVAGGIPNDDIFQITKSGIYYYKETTKNVPYFEPTENSTGYIWAVFQKDSNYGLLFFLGSFTYIEKWAGTWRTFFSPQPVKLWKGSATVNQTITLADSIQNYRYIRFTFPAANTAAPVTLTTFQSTKEFLVGLRTLQANGKGEFIDQITYSIIAPTQLKYLRRIRLNTSNGAVDDLGAKGQPGATLIEGIR